jgi:hypothetical protein
MVTKFYFSNGPISAMHSLYIGLMVIIAAVVGMFAMGLEGWISVFVSLTHRLRIIYVDKNTKHTLILPVSHSVIML